MVCESPGKIGESAIVVSQRLHRRVALRDTRYTVDYLTIAGTDPMVTFLRVREIETKLRRAARRFLRAIVSEIVGKWWRWSCVTMTQRGACRFSRVREQTRASAR